MIEIDDTIVSLDIVQDYFLCDLARCKGACCVEGDSGAPLEKEEIAKLEAALPHVWDDLSPKAREVIDRQGVAYIDTEGDIVTSIVNGKDCVFTYYDQTGHANVPSKKHIVKERLISTSLFHATFIPSELHNTEILKL